MTEGLLRKLEVTVRLTNREQGFLLKWKRKKAKDREIRGGRGEFNFFFKEW